MSANQSNHPANAATAGFSNFRRTKTFRRLVRHTVSYLILGAGSLFMLFPMLWMITASFKPPWQIFTEPPIWIPQRWEHVQAGNTNLQLDIWRVPHEGERVDVIEIGTRRYTTVIDLSKLEGIQAVPPEQISEASVAEVSGIAFNLRSMTVDAATQEVVALARGEDDALLVVEVSQLLPAAMRLPLDVVNGGERARMTVGEIEFRARDVVLEGETVTVFPIGPETQFTVVAPPEVATRAELTPVETLVNAGYAPVGETELPIWAFADSEGDTHYIKLGEEAWQPVIDEVDLDIYAFVADNSELQQREQRPVNGIVMETAIYHNNDGAAVAVVVLLRGTQNSLVLREDHAHSLILAQSGGLTSARGDTFERIPYRVQDNFTVGENIRSVALIGEPRNMALIIPANVVDEAFDVPQASLERALVPEIRLDGYKQALETKVAQVHFPRFFVNSFGLVFLNIIGHLLSCVVVAYAFARLRAPGKNLLFVIVLSTMMLPFPVTIVPLYEIFRDLGMINTWYPLFLRSFFGNAFLIFMLRQFFAAIPRELEDAARIDGAGTLGIILRIIVPLSRPALATVVIFTFWWTWNSFLEPFIYLTSPELFPVSVGLNFFKDQFGAIYYDRLIAASVLSMVPMIVLFFFAQRYFIEGIQLTGLKG